MRLSQGMSGIRKSSAKGSSVEFSDFREYMLGDDIRRIDWNAYGRTDKLYIKQFMEEKEGIFQIFIDTSRSMCFGEKPKSTMALQIAGALSYIVLNNQDRVYINEMKENSLTKGKGVTGGAAFSHVLNDLNRMVFDGKTTLNKTILSRPVQVGGVSIIISDFMDENGMEEALKYLAYRKQTIVLIQVLAKEEVEVNYEGKLMNGYVFDSSYERNEPAKFSLNRVIKGWTEGMKLVGEGGEIILYIPANLAYGQWGNQRGGIGPNQALEFRVELLSVTPAEAK
jgi:uncharacterized protein (DUF58 family)